MSRARAGLLACASALVAATPAVARAQQGTAQAQFDYGLAEMEAGRYATGCPALAESYRIDPHPGALFTLAECENKAGKIASALTHYEAYLDLFSHMSGELKARQRGRDRISSAQIARLRTQVPQLAIALPASAPPGTTVTSDGVVVGAPSLGVPLPVDPGEHVIVARTPDGVDHQTRVTLVPGERKSVELDLSPPAPQAPPPPGVPGPTPGAPAPSSSLRTWALISGGVGLAAVAAGAVAGAIVLGDKSTIDSQCRPDLTCSPSGLSAAGQARTFGVVSDVGFAAGGAAIAAALVLRLASPGPVHGVRPVASVEPHGGFVGARVAW